MRREGASPASKVVPTRTTPEDGDVVVRETRQKRSHVYVLHTATGPDQCLLRTLEEAVTQAVAFAKNRHVRAWVTDEGHAFVLLDDFGVTLIQGALNRLRAEYLEMPGLRLKRGQVERLCGVEGTVCQMVLDVLVDEKFLCAKPDGHYARLTDGTIQRPQPAKAHIGIGTRPLKAS